MVNKMLLILTLAYAQEISVVPSTGTPPDKMTRTASIYDPIDNQIITFGGFIFESGIFSAEIIIFRLNTNTWWYPRPQSLIKPEGLVFPALFLRPDRKLLVIFGATKTGISSDVYSYNLITDNWKIESLIGDPILGASNSLSVALSYNNTEYLAIFGGINKIGVGNTLYLINTMTLDVRKMPNFGIAPENKIEGSMVYFNKSLYMFGSTWSKPDINNNEIFCYSLIQERWTILEVNGLKPITRALHHAFVYQDSMYMFYGTSPDFFLKEIWRFNFTSTSWSLMLNNSDNFRYSFSFANSNNQFYILFGRDLEAIYNSIDLYEINENSIEVTHITGNWNIPTARTGHISSVIFDKMYVFGGVSNTGEYLNDMWMYDMTLNKWSRVSTLGTSPSGRSSSSSVKTIGFVFTVMFGSDASSVFNDFYTFEAFSNTWKKLNIEGELPEPRFDECSCIYEYYAFTIGGQNGFKTFNDIWVFNYLSNSYMKLKKFNSLPFSLVKHKCWIVIEREALDIYIVGGCSISSAPNFNLYKISFEPDWTSTYEFKVSSIFSSKYIGVFDCGFVMYESSVMLIFGSTSNLNTNPNIISLNYITLELKINDMHASLALSGHTSVHYKNYLYIYGGIPGLDGLKPFTTPTNQLLKLKNSVTSNIINIPCSSGTFKPNCEPCPEGTFANGDYCTLCPRGSYSTSIAANTINQCIPCDYGKFSEVEGSTKCFDCPKNLYCPIGASVPKKNIKLNSYQSRNPSAYKNDSSDIQALLNYSSISVICSTILLSFFLFFSDTLQKIVKKFDIFVDKHKQNLNLPVIYRKSIIGGLFSISFLMIVVSTIITSVMTFKLNNITETRSLVPIKTMNAKIIADIFEVEIIYYFYGANCTQNDTCSSLTLTSEQELQFENKSMQCKNIGSNCILNIKYSKFLMSSSWAKIIITQNDLSAYASFLSVNISVSSSIPEGPSAVFIPVKPDSEEKLFKGRIPTTLYFEMIPTIFYSDSGNWNDMQTGFHIKDSKSFDLGETVTQSTIFTAGLLIVELDISTGSNGFIVSRNMNTSFIMMFGAVLGSIFGLAGSFAAVMNLFESGAMNLYERVQKIRAVHKILSSRKRINSEFCNQIQDGRFYKVHPLQQMAKETLTS